MNYTDGIIKDTEFFTTSELAQKLKMNVQVITRKIQAGEIEAYKIGKEWRIPEQSVYKWLENRSNQNSRSSKVKAAASLVKNDYQEELPKGGTKHKYLLEYILAQFEPNRVYSEDEVNRVITRHHNDYTAVRQEFVTEKMMDRTGDTYRRRTGYTLSDKDLS
jgi:excisionase family DNA binding protein